MVKREKRKTVPTKNRTHVRDCEVGDVMRLECGRVFVFTSWLSGGAFGRELLDGEEGEFEPIDDSLRMKIINDV